MRWRAAQTSDSGPLLLRPVGRDLRKTAGSEWNASDRLARAINHDEGRSADSGGRFHELMRNAAARSGDGRINDLAGLD